MEESNTASEESLASNNEDSESTLDDLDESIEQGTATDSDLVVVTQDDASATLEGNNENAAEETTNDDTADSEENELGTTVVLT